ncbi:caspase domain-containing protein [Armillaria mellea]|nr:caspase domain-containing protein [Armillaria mellea]
MSILGNTLFEVRTRVVLFFGRFDNFDLVLAALLMLGTLPLLRKILAGGEHFYNRLRMALPSDDSSTPPSSRDCLSIGDSDHSEMEEIDRLTEDEQALAKLYGMDGGDSVEVFYEAKARALSGKDAPAVEAYEKLHKLYHLRLKFAGIQRMQSLRLKPSPDQKILGHRLDASRFWAVLIGIDAYKISPLRGCVSDALTMESYLVKDLGVPKERIQRLLGPTEHRSLNDSTVPSRANIISSLHSLVDNPQIECGDNIIIYFSGHGSCYSPSDLDHGAGMGSIEALCPIDREDLDADDVLIPDISDREINCILKEISRTKGNHITFILDCCHSGSVTRGIDESGTRTIPPLPRASLKSMLSTAEEAMKSFAGYHSILEEDWCPDMTSHVVLAACKEYQFAREVKGKDGFNGFFTQALLSTLRSNNLTEESTYIDLIRALPGATYQSPVVAGRLKDVRLWYQ